MPSNTTHRNPAQWAVAALAGSTIVLGTVACSAAPAAPALDTVGRVDGSAALVAVIAADDQLIAYVCDGETALGERFTGTAVDGHADLRSAGGAQLLVDLTAGATEGTFTAAHGAPQHFTTVATTGDDAGFFAVEGETSGGHFSAGWVELNDGTQSGSGRKGERPARARPLVHHRVPAGRPGAVTPPTVIPPTRGPVRAPNGNPGIVPPAAGPGTVGTAPGGGAGDVPQRAPVGVGPGGRVRPESPGVAAGNGTSSDVSLGRVGDTFDSPTALIDGVGEVTPSRVVTNDLFKRVGDQ